MLEWPGNYGVQLIQQVFGYRKAGILLIRYRSARASDGLFIP
ncbi:MAG: hypothetical protein ACJA2W_001672 [Planctomycetota bacterium]|jgi:hypothetical protein